MTREDAEGIYPMNNSLSFPAKTLKVSNNYLSFKHANQCSIIEGPFSYINTEFCGLRPF